MDNVQTRSWQPEEVAMGVDRIGAGVLARLEGQRWMFSARQG
jgi:hypothetical protein